MFSDLFVSSGAERSAVISNSAHIQLIKLLLRQVPLARRRDAACVWSRFDQGEEKKWVVGPWYYTTI